MSTKTTKKVTKPVPKAPVTKAAAKITTTMSAKVPNKIASKKASPTTTPSSTPTKTKPATPTQTLSTKSSKTTTTAKKPIKSFVSKTTTTAQNDDNTTVGRPYDVENMIKTKYIAPSKNGAVNTATMKINTSNAFGTAKDDAAHVIFVTKEQFGSELNSKSDTGADDDATSDDSSEDVTVNKSATTKNNKKSTVMDTNSLKSTYGLLQWNTIVPALRAQNFKAGPGNVAAVPNQNGTPVFIVGMGKLDSKTKSISPANYRKAISTATKAVRKLQINNVEMQLPLNLDVNVKEDVPTGFGNGVDGLRQQERDVMSSDDKASHGIRSIITSNYSFDHYLAPKVQNTKHFKFSNLTLVTPKSVQLSNQLIHTAAHRAESENFAKEIGSLRSNLATNEYMKKQCEELVAAHPDVLKIKVMDKKALQDAGHSMILAVNQGSAIQPFIVGIEYTPPPMVDVSTTVKGNKNGKQQRSLEDKSIVYIGKTLTFDTGGYSLKPPSSMDTMYTDKHGGCNTLALMRTLALTRPQTQHKIVGVLTITDNQIGPNAIHPSDVFKTPKGTVSIDNTDAEGRLALADAITFAQKEYNPKRITTMATLTGAITIALGNNTGAFSNHKRLLREIMDSADNHGEVIWNMPILKENHTAMEATETDLKNVAKGRGMGSSTAAAFLEKFIAPKVSFIHLDIAGSSTTNDNTVTGNTVPTLQDIMSKH